MPQKIHQEKLWSIKGFKIIGTATQTARNGNVVFFRLVNKEHEIELEPKSLEYQDDRLRGVSAREQISLKGFITRINNVLGDEALQKRLDKNINEVKTLEEANIALKEWASNNQTYAKQELFDKLLKDLEICNAKNDKMTIDRQYKSEWKSKALDEYKNWDKTQKEKLLEKLKTEQDMRSKTEQIITKQSQTQQKKNADNGISS